MAFDCGCAAGGREAADVHVRQPDPNGKGMDKLFQHRIHEYIHGRFWGMDEAQGEGAILKQWKQPRMIYWNLTALNKRFGCGMRDNEIYKVPIQGLDGTGAWATDG